MFKKILVATDGSDHSRKAVELAAILAAQDAAEVVVVHVVLSGEVSTDVQRMIDVEFPIIEPVPTLEPDVQTDTLAFGSQSIDITKHMAASHRIFRILGEQIVQQAEQTLKEKGSGKVCHLILEGNPAGQILKAIADEHPDLVICGARGLSNFTALLLGSVSNKIAHLCSATCITVR